MKRATLTIALSLYSLACSTKPVSATGDPVKIPQSTREYQIMCWTIKKYEGFSLEPYECVAGVRTVGWGFTSAVGVTSVKSVKDADEKFRDIIGKVKSRIDSDYPDLPNRYRIVLTSLVYNTGAYNALRKSTLVKYMRSGNLAKVKSTLMQWNKYKDPISNRYVVSNGLTNRRKWECRILEGLTEREYNQLKGEVASLYRKGLK